MPDTGNGIIYNNLYNKQVGVRYPTVDEESDVQKGECLAQDHRARVSPRLVWLLIPLLFPLNTVVL